MFDLDYAMSEKFGGAENVNAEIAKFIEALEHHSHTENEPAPTTNPIIEEIVFRHSGQYNIVNVPEPEPEPEIFEPTPANTPLSMRQLRQGLRAFAGKPASFIQDTINKIPDPGARDDAQIWFEETTEVHWESPVTQSLIALAGFKPDEAAALWLKIAKEVPR